MDIGILGPLTVTRDGRDVPIGAAKQRALVAVFALHRNEVVPTATLIDELWGDDPPATATKIVHTYVSQLRKVLGEDVLQTRAGGYLLRATPDEVDSARFESLLTLGRQELAGGRPQKAAGLLRSALALWRGTPLAEFLLSDGATDEVERLEQLHLVALECRLDADIACGGAATAIPELQLLVRHHPLRESLRGSLMLALYRTGRQADALAVYADTRATLVDQLGVDPSGDLQRLQAAILDHDPALDYAAAPAGGMTAPVAAAIPVGATATAKAPTVATPFMAPLGSGFSPAHAPPAPTALNGTVGSLVPLTTSVPLASSSSALPAQPERATKHRSAWRRAPVTVVVCIGVVCIAALGMAREGAAPAAQTLIANSVGFVASDQSTVTKQVAVPGSPTAITFDGPVVWAVVPDTNSVVRIGTRAGSIAQTIPVGNDPSAVLDAGGSVWVANHDSGTVSRISPDTNQVVATVPVGTGPLALADGFGSVWVTNGDDRTLTRIDERTGAVVATIDTNTVGRGVVTDSSAVWITDEATGRIVAVDPTTDAVTATIPVGSGPTALTVAGGAIWVVNALAGTVSRVDPITEAVTLTVPLTGGPSAISADSGVVWVTTEFNSQVVRIDPGDGRVINSIALGIRPEAVAATNGGAWISAQANGTAHRGGRLVAASEGIDSIDPSAGDLIPGRAELAYDALTSLRYAGGSAGTQIFPDLAVSLPEPTDGGTSYTFHLRPHITYSDGKPLQAEDLRLGLERLLVLDSYTAQLFADVVGAQRCAGKPTCDLAAGVAVDGASTITFHLTRPDPEFMVNLSQLVPIPPGTPFHDMGTTPVPGTGPYAIATFVPGHLLTYERNRYFRASSDAARPDGYPDEIVYLVGLSEVDAAARVADGQVDLAELVSFPPDARQLAVEHPRQVHIEDEQSLLIAFLNTKSAPFNDVRVRQAVNFAVDRRQMADLYGATLARPTCQIIPPTTTGYRPYCPYTVDPSAEGLWVGPDLARAQALVNESGTKGQAVTVWILADYDQEGRAFSDVLNQLGYRSTVHEIPHATAYFDALEKAPNAQAGVFGWFDASLAWDSLSVLTCDFDFNPAHFCDPRLDADIDQLGRTEPTDPEAASSLAERIDQQITDQAPWVPLFNPQTINLTSARVGNYQSERGRLLVDQLWVQ
jgi:peptide/nickel transport system substrate-binding protein